MAHEKAEWEMGWKPGGGGQHPSPPSSPTSVPASASSSAHSSPTPPAGLGARAAALHQLKASSRHQRSCSMPSQLRTCTLHAHTPSVSPTAPPRRCPVYKLTVDLANTYKRINQTYFEGEEAVNEHDDEQHDYVVQAGELLDERFRVLSPLGRGAFGQVVLCETADSTRQVAVKIVKNVRAYRQQGLVEVELLEEIMREDPQSEFGIVVLEEAFDHCGHLCLVLERLSLSLYDVLKASHFRGLSLGRVRRLAYQIVSSLCFLEAVDIIHCDLKPENILLRDAKKSGIKVIDFGSACRASERPFKYVQSRFYRAPEVILELEYSTAIDMWSLGCILAELHTGEVLLPGADEASQLHKMAELLGPFPEKMIRASPKLGKFFNYAQKEFSLRTAAWMPSEHRSVEEVLKARKSTSKTPPSEAEMGDFVDLVKRMLTFQPVKRISPLQAVQHRFFAPFFPPQHDQASGSRQQLVQVQAESKSMESGSSKKEHVRVMRSRSDNG